MDKLLTTPGLLDPNTMKKTLQLLIFLILLLLAIWGAYAYIEHQNSYPSTDDAYIQSNIVNIAPQVTGHIQSVNVKENQLVKAGAALFVIDPQPFEIALRHAQSQLQDTITQVNSLESAIESASASVKAQRAAMIEADRQYKRIAALYKQNNVSSTQMDQSTSQRNQAAAQYQASVAKLHQTQKQLGQLGDQNAQIKMARASVAQAQLDLRHTVIRAPAKGIISNLTLRPGDEVTTAQNLFAIIESGHWWAQANFKETQLKRIRPGQTVNIKLDMYPDEKVLGKVESIGYGSGDTFALLPAENATGNWVKVTQRFAIRISIDPTKQHLKEPLRVGASCTVTIDTTSK
jgi:membrane fusion protein (multidrug efflux system)